MSLDLSQFKALIIRPTLAILDLSSPAAENLLLGTALTESGLVYLHQLGAGPALGVYQCEPATHNDLWSNFIPSIGARQGMLRGLIGTGDILFQLVCNLAYATAICRLHYYRIAAPLPVANDAPALAAYHKKWYNTSLGATDPAKSVTNFQRAIAA